MSSEWLNRDRVIPCVKKILEEATKSADVEIGSLIIYGSRGAGDRNSSNQYDFLILIDSSTPLNKFVRFNSTLKLLILKEKLTTVKMLVYTPEIFEDLLYNDILIGTFLYMITRENIVIYDRDNRFRAICERLKNNTIKGEDKFLKQCINFARDLGSQKWERKWEKTLMHYNYMKKRREHY